MYSFEGAHVAITGGGSGIGLELARQFMFSGAAAISLLDISGCASALASLKAEQAGLSTQSNVNYFQADVTEYIQVKQALSDAEQKQGCCVDVLVANAGVGPCGLFLEAEVGHWAAVCSVNYLGVVHTLKAGVPAMVARGGGRVVVINSTGAAGISAYCASKFAVRGFMDSLRLELLGTGMTLHMACPGFVDTPMIRDAQAAASDNVKKLKASFVPTMMTAAQVARYTVRGLAQGRYIIGSPDRGANMIVGSSLAAVSARFYPLWLELLAAPAFVLLHHAVRIAVEAATLRVLAPPPPSEQDVPLLTGATATVSVLSAGRGVLKQD